MRPASRIAAIVFVAITAVSGLAGCGASDKAGTDAADSSASPSADSSASSPTAASSEPRRLEVDAFAALVDTAGTVVLDVRTPAEFKSGHLAGAVNIDFESADFNDKIAALDKSASYAVYCRTGNRSRSALARMAAAGFTTIADLSTGLAGWTSSGRALTTN